MASSGTYTFSFPFDDIIVESWERCGKNANALTGDIAASARRSLQLMQIDWTNRGVPLWQVQTITAVLVSGAASYAMPAYVVDVLDSYVNDGSADRILGRISRTEYAAYPNKAQSGRPTQFWIDRQAPQIDMTFYPVPDAAATYTLTSYIIRQPQDVGALTNTADAPMLWSEAMAAGLAARLAEKFVPERFAEKVAIAEKAWTAAFTENRDRVPLSIIPSWG